MKRVDPLWWKLAGLAVAYTVTAQLGLLLAFPGTNATAVWFPTGLALGVLLRWGYRLWPGVALGALLANLGLLTDMGWPLPTAVAASGCTAAGNTLEALAGAYLIQRFAGTSNPFRQSHHVFVFATCGALAATTISATMGTTVFCLGEGRWSSWAGIWLTWWLGDAVGSLVAAPLIVTWRPFHWKAIRWKRAVETALLVAAIFGISWIVFAYAYTFNFLLVLVLLAAVFHLGQFGSAAVVSILCVVFTFSIAHGLGVIAGWDRQTALLVDQGFIGAVAIATMLLAAILKERTEAGEMLQASEQQIRLIMENLADLVTVLDLEGRRLYNSPSYRPILGDPERLRGSLFFEHVHPEDKSRVRQVLQETVRSGVGRRFEFCMIDHQGRPHRIESQNSVIRDSRGQVAQVVIVSRDVTERRQADEEVRRLHAELKRRAEELERRVGERTAELQDTEGALMNLVEDLNEKTRELALAKERAEAADKIKSAFLATMSHELRTPLNSIIGFTGIILQGLAGPLNPEQRKQLEMVRSSARHLLALINDVLDISKIEAAQLKVTRERVAVRPTTDRVIGIVRPLAEAKGIALHVDLAPNVDIVSADQRRVEQVLLNLLNNAVKFTEQGSVTLSARRTLAEGEGAGTCIEFCVSDTGIGIPPDSLSTLFQPFRQIDTGLSRQHEGTGLGLAICRRLTELMGGKITVTSELGRGSIFRFTLPVDEPELK